MEYVYRVSRKVASIEEGTEIDINRFAGPKQYDGGCFVYYNSQDGTQKQLMQADQVTPVWLNGSDTIDCMVDFVPSFCREMWSELRKLGQCYLWHDTEFDMWTVYYPFAQKPLVSEYTVESIGARAISDAIQQRYEDLKWRGIVHNGYRWFDCREDTFKKISDQEAEKLNV